MSVDLALRSDLTDYELQSQLDGITFTFRLYWNTREEAWYLDVQAEDGTPILSSMKVVVMSPLGRRSTDSRRPAGLLLAYDTSGLQKDPGKTDLGDRVIVTYFPTAELPVT